MAFPLSFSQAAGAPALVRFAFHHLGFITSRCLACNSHIFDEFLASPDYQQTRVFDLLRACGVRRLDSDVSRA